MKKKTIYEAGEIELIENVKSLIQNHSLAASFDSYIELIGGDCASLDVLNTSIMCISTDSFVEGVHFESDLSSSTEIFNAGFKAAARCLSDIGANGAKPAGLLVACVLKPILQISFLEDFYRGLIDYCNTVECPLVGGDFAQGSHNSFTLTAIGKLKNENKPITRLDAKVGDDIYITGAVGFSFLEYSGFDFNQLPDEYKSYSNRFSTPIPPVSFMVESNKSNLISASIDVTDGFFEDAIKLSKTSEVGLEVELDALPLASIDLKSEQLRQALSFGDDYEYLFTAPKSSSDKLKEIAKKHEIMLTKIGRCSNLSHKATFFSLKGKHLSPPFSGYRHFVE